MFDWLRKLMCAERIINTPLPPADNTEKTWYPPTRAEGIAIGMEQIGENDWAGEAVLGDPE